MAKGVAEEIGIHLPQLLSDLTAGKWLQRGLYARTEGLPGYLGFILSPSRLAVFLPQRSATGRRCIITG